MTEFLKNNPIALRHCLLYVFLQNKSVEKAFDDFCKTVGNYVINKEECQIWSDQFEKGLFDDNQKPIDNLADILRNDKQALRVCVLYEWLTVKNIRLEKWMYSRLKYEALPVFDKYNNFCKVIGVEEVLKYPEFEFWFYRFVNGNFDLSYERDEHQKIYELTDIPLDVMKDIVGYLDILDRMALKRTSKSLQTFVEDQKLFHPSLSFYLGHCSADISIGKSSGLKYGGNRNCCYRNSGRNPQVFQGVAYWEQAILDFKNFIKNPKLHLDTLSINLHLYKKDNCLVRDEKIINEFQDSLKFIHYLNVKTLNFRGLYWHLLLKILPSLKPGYLTTIELRIDSDEEVMETITGMEQWKQAKYFDMRVSLFTGPLRYLYHFEKFQVRCKKLSVEDVREMKKARRLKNFHHSTFFKILFNSPNFKDCSLHFLFSIDRTAIGLEFGKAVEGTSYSYNYPIPNSDGFFEIKVHQRILLIERKNK